MDIELVIGFAFTFCLAIIFLVVGFSQGKVAKPFFYTAAGICFFIMGPIYAVMEQTYIFVALVFLIPGVFSFSFAGVSFFQLYKHTTMEDWQKDEDEP